MKVVDNGKDIILEGCLRSTSCDTIDHAEVQIFEENIFVTSTVTEDGKFHVVIPTFGVGVRNFKVIYSGDSNYNGSESEYVTIEVRNSSVVNELQCVVDKNELQLGERAYFTVYVKSQYNELMNGVSVDLRMNGKVVDTQVSKDGLVIFRFTPSREGEFRFIAESGGVSSNIISVSVHDGKLLSDYTVDFNINFGISGMDDLITVETFLKKI